eukprot:2699104-Prymnesium_polylepis.1
MTSEAGHVEQDSRRTPGKHLEIARFLIRKNQSFLLRFDYGDATFLSGTLPASCQNTGQPQFHM